MSIYYKSEDYPIFKVFEQLVHLTFNFKWDGENIIERGPEQIKQENLSLLLAWPGILMMKLVQITGDSFYDKALKELTTNLDNGADFEQVKNFLDKFIDSKKIPDKISKKINEAVASKDNRKISKIKRELYNYVPDIFIKAILLLHPRNLHLVTGRELVALVYSLTDFFVLWCMIVRCFERNDGDTYITKSAMNESYLKCQDKNHINIYLLSYIFPNIADSVNKIAVDQYLESKKTEKIFEAFILSKIKTPSIKFALCRIFPNNNLAYIKNFESVNTNFGLNSETLGIGYNIRKPLGYPNDLWKTTSFNNPKSSGYLLFNETDTEKDFIYTLMEELFRSARMATKTSDLLLSKWRKFIDNPYDRIDKNIDKYYDWISSTIFHDYLIREEFFKFKSFSRIIGDIDTEMDYPVVNEVRELYKKAKIFHIPIEHKKKLDEANIELEGFIKTVIKNDYCTEEKYIRYFNKTKLNYKYISLLEEDDIKEIIFSTEANALRDSRRKILSIINNKLGGKDFKESTLTKLLGLEKGTQNYLKFAG